jgi:hypothetical protein
MNMKLQILFLFLSLIVSESPQIVTVYNSADELPKDCELIGPVKASKSYKKNAPEYEMSGKEVIAQVSELCITEANAIGGNAFVNVGYTSFHGADYFGYSCKGNSYQC